MKFFKAANATPGLEASSPGWRERLRTTKVRTLGVIVVAGAMVVPSTRSAGAAGQQYGPSGAVPSSGTKIAGGTAYFQEGPAAPPTYIFPFISPQVCSTMNYGQLTYMMYRP